MKKQKHHFKHHRATYLFLIPPLLLFMILLHLFLSHFVYFNTRIGALIAGGKTADAMHTALSTLISKPVSISVQNRIYQYTYQDLGITVTPEKTYDLLLQPNRSLFPINLILLVRSFFLARLVDPPLVFSDTYTTRVQSMIYDFRVSDDTVAYTAMNELIYYENGERYAVDPITLREQILLNFGNEKLLKPTVIKIPNIQKDAVRLYNNKLQFVFSEPILITANDGNLSQTFALTPKELSGFTRIRYDTNTSILRFDIQEEIFTKLLNNRLNGIRFPKVKKVSVESAVSDITSVLNWRLNGRSAESVTLVLLDGPKTNGDVAQKYIEATLSQQRMYLFSGGRVIHSYKISTGKYYPTPTGTFTISNKIALAFSNIYQVWMPYWMGFTYIPELNASLGIHEIPYALSDDGKKQTRQTDYINAPNTGGCIALESGSAREVFRFADIGTPLVIDN